MPELTANVKIGLGIMAASAALITGILGNVLAANISAHFSGTPPKTGKRPAILWAAFFVSAALSVVAGSFATFAPAAPTRTPQQPKIVVTNVDGQLLQSDVKSLMIICRDTVQMANTSDITTSVVAVGTQINVDGSLMSFEPAANGTTKGTAEMRVAAENWKTAPLIKNYANIKSVDQFASIPGVPLPVRTAARSTATVYVDFAMHFAKLMPQNVMAMHVLRFPDIADIKTNWVRCK